MHDHVRFDHDVVPRTPRSEAGRASFLERWIAVLLPAGLALLLGIAVVITTLVADPNGTPGDHDIPDGYGVTQPHPALPEAPSDP